MAESIHGIHIDNKTINVDELVAVDMTVGLHRNVRHSHKNAYELIYVGEGHMVVQIGDTWTDMNAGNCVLVPRDTVHDSLSETESAIVLYFAFTSRNDLSFLEEKFIHLPHDDWTALQSLLPTITKGYLDMVGHHNVYTLVHTQESPYGMEQLTLNYLEMLILIAIRELQEDQNHVGNITHKQKSKAIADNATRYIANQVNQYIEDHYRENLTVEKIAQHFKYSRSRISVIYKQESGMGINEAINNAKLNQARNLLIESDMSIHEISEHLGFSSPQYFTNRFTKSTGMSPSNYAKFKHTKVN